MNQIENIKVKEDELIEIIKSYRIKEFIKNLKEWNDNYSFSNFEYHFLVEFLIHIFLVWYGYLPILHDFGFITKETGYEEIYVFDKNKKDPLLPVILRLNILEVKSYEPHSVTKKESSAIFNKNDNYDNWKYNSHGKENKLNIAIKSFNAINTKKKIPKIRITQKTRVFHNVIGINKIDNNKEMDFEILNTNFRDRIISFFDNKKEFDLSYIRDDLINWKINNRSTKIITVGTVSSDNKEYEEIKNKKYDFFEKIYCVTVITKNSNYFNLFKTLQEIYEESN